jgi:hypothetical protein
MFAQDVSKQWGNFAPLVKDTTNIPLIYHKPIFFLLTKLCVDSQKSAA